MSLISANDLKTRGVSAIEAALAHDTKAVISVRVKSRFVVVALEHFQYLRECELEAALAQTKADLADGRYVTSTPEEHAQRLKSDGDK